MVFSTLFSSFLVMFSRMKKREEREESRNLRAAGG